MKTLFFNSFLCGVLFFSSIYGQNRLYTNTFPLGDVTLLDGPFKHACDLNIQTLLQYDVDRLLATYLIEAGLTPKGALFPNWSGLDGHVGGHYLSALAIHYAATGNSDCLERMEYMISELKTCQDSNTVRYPDWGAGYVGGVPDSDQIWSTLKAGDFTAYRQAWVPWYNIHKMYAGLRDAWLYGGNEEAGTIFLKFCDWGINMTSALTDSQMETMLDTEHGGMNEVFADAYQMTGDEKYLTAAKRFSHKYLLDAMASGNDNLDNLHANTQVPKAVGFQRIAELCSDNTYIDAARFFWETVTGNRSLAFGGNSRREHFPSAADCGDYVDEVQGPESCNTHNMLKLTEDLFRQNPLAKYADFYERALYNHILSTQHPEHGGYVYFTPARPGHYRVYSAPNQAMWCCVGTGMENHGKYGQFIYTHRNDSLFINLFIASELDWKEKAVKMTQETDFPNEEKTRLTITEGSSPFKLMIRYPAWVASDSLKVTVNGDKYPYSADPSSYIQIDRPWTAGDVVEIILPMHTRLEPLINVPEYVAFMHGPILLGARTNDEYLTGLIADDSRWGHIASGPVLPLDEAPIIVENDRSDITDKLAPVEGKHLTFAVSELNIVNSQNIQLEPFYNIHDSRYMMYWMALTDTQYKAYIESLGENDNLSERTIDSVATGENQSELEHAMQKSNSYSGTHMGESWRDARNGGYFSYNLATNGETGLYLMVRYWGNEYGNRTFDILINDEKLKTVNISGVWNVMDFKNMEYRILKSMLSGKDTIRVKFQAPSNGYAGGVFYIRLLRREGATAIKRKRINQPCFFELHQNYPNPFNPKTTIGFALPKACDVKLEVCDIAGRRVATLINDELEAGDHTVDFHVSNLASGIYFYLLKAGDFSSVKKFIFIK
ncbi:MAG: glycoside hydrolase family 127 protein [Sedimentisphaerales bacterium]|nr:glycoside hydrolase family 127 protein [Sedimentisphaerales bacterium]